MLVGIVGILLLLRLGNTRDTWLPNRSLRDTGKGSLKAIKLGLSQDNLDRWDPYRHLIFNNKSNYINYTIHFMYTRIYNSFLSILIFTSSYDASLTLRVLRRIFGSNRFEVTGEWRKLHNEELNDLYWSPNIVRVINSSRMRWEGHVARMGEVRGVYRVLVGGTCGKQTAWGAQA